MNYHSLIDATQRAATVLGYHPTLRDSLHLTLRREGFPIASIAPPKLLSVEGVQEMEMCYLLEVNLLTYKCMTPAASAEVMARLADDAVALAGELAKCSSVVEVTIEEVAPVERLLTIAGEEALCLRMRVRSLECNK